MTRRISKDVRGEALLYSRCRNDLSQEDLDSYPDIREVPKQDLQKGISESLDWLLQFCRQHEESSLTEDDLLWVKSLTH